MGPPQEVVVIGGGQAGLAVGYFLAEQGRRFTILEAAAAPAAAWRGRWDSLELFTPVRYSGLPGRPFAGDPDSYPTRDDVVAYLADYARQFELPVELNTRVESVRAGDRGYVVEAAGRAYEADQVIVATGPFQVPRVPALAEGLDPEVPQLHSSAYASPDDLPRGPVVVVGGGNTGFQIAEELAGSREVHLSIGSRQTPLPQRFLGRDLFWYLEATGLMGKTAESRIGRRMRERDTLIGSRPRTLRRRHGVRLRPRTASVSGSTVRFSDDTELVVSAVVWATGFGLDHSWIDLPVLDDSGMLRHERGVTTAPGLYCVGMPWQHTRGSALLGWVGHDAEHVAKHVAALQATGAAAQRREVASSTDESRLEPTPASAISDQTGAT